MDCVNQFEAKWSQCTTQKKQSIHIVMAYTNKRQYLFSFSIFIN